jgi:hypothetical protein
VGCGRLSASVGAALTVGRLVLAMQQSLIPVSDRTRAWHEMNRGDCYRCSGWVREEIRRMRTPDQA